MGNISPKTGNLGASVLLGITFICAGLRGSAAAAAAAAAA
jgi:hypothetical protein